MHIMFQVANFIYGPASDAYDLLPNDKLLLLLLAKHSGPKGIYPAITTLAKELKLSERYIKTRIDYLYSKNLLRIERKLGRNNHYYLCDFESIGDLQQQSYPQTSDLQITSEPQITGDPQIRGGVIYRSPDPASVDPPISSLSSQIIKSERAPREKRAAHAPAPQSPLSFFEPDEQRRILAQDLRLNLQEEIESFRARHNGRGDLQYEFERWIKNSKQYQARNQRPEEVKSNLLFWGPGHPSWEALHAKRKSNAV